MGGDAHSIVGGCIDNRSQFFIRELRVLPALRDAQYATGGGDLDPVRAVLVTLAHSLAGILDAVYDSVYRTRVALDVIRPAIGRVAMSTGRTQSFRRGDYPGTGYVPVFDRCTQRYGHVERVPEVSHNRETGLQRPPCELRRIERVIGFIHDEVV